MEMSMCVYAPSVEDPSLSDHLCMTPFILLLKLCPDWVYLPQADPAAVPTPHH